MTSTPAIHAVVAAGIPHEILTYGRAETIEEAAVLRAVPVESIVKTLAVRRGEDDFVLVLVSGDRSIDWKKLRAHLGVSRLTMADREELVAVTGYERGTVTPFGTTREWPVHVDSIVAELERASLGGGAHGVAINLRGADIVSHFGSAVSDLSKKT